MRPLRWLPILFALLSAATADLVVSPAEWRDSPPVPAGSIASQTFRIANQGTAPVTILSATGTNQLNLNLQQDALPPGAETVLTAVFRAPESNDDVDTVGGEIVLLLDSEQDRVTVPFEFIVQPPPPDEPRVAESIPPYSPTGDEHPITVRFFYNGSCGSCTTFLANTFEPVMRHFKAAPVTFELHDVTAPDENELLQQTKARYGTTEVSNTNLFVGRHDFVGNETIADHLYDTILAEMASPSEEPPAIAAGDQMMGPPLTGDLPYTREQVRTLTGPGVFFAGLVDGLNPCAIATAIFLVVMLTRLGHDRKVLLAVGVAYTLAVFATYFAVGLGLRAALGWLSGAPLGAKLLNWGIAAIAFVFAGLQVRDVVRYRAGGSTREMAMQMPLALKRLSHGFLRTNLARPLIVLGAALAGVLVTLLEAVCTGQVYLPIVQALNLEDLRGRALQLLGIYNLGFVVPLVLILALTYRGVRSESMAGAARRLLIPAKLALALLLASLGAYLLLAAPH